MTKVYQGDQECLLYEMMMISLKICVDIFIVVWYDFSRFLSLAPALLHGGGVLYIVFQLFHTTYTMMSVRLY